MCVRTTYEDIYHILTYVMRTLCVAKSVYTYVHVHIV